MSETQTEVAYRDALKWMQRVSIQLSRLLGERSARVAAVSRLVSQANEDLIGMFVGDRKQDLLDALAALSETDENIRKVSDLGDAYTVVARRYEIEAAVRLQSERERRRRVAKMVRATRMRQSNHPEKVVSAPEVVTLPVPVIEVPFVARTETHLLSDELDRIARWQMSWAPWARRNRYLARRYEGFSR